jgi:uncharacterized membrane protein (DUF441 family)
MTIMPPVVTATVEAETTATSAVEVAAVAAVVADTMIAMIVTLVAPAMLPQPPAMVNQLQLGNLMVAALMTDTPIESSDC